MKQDKKDKLVKTLDERIRHSDSFLSSYKDKFNRYYALFRSYMNDTEWATKSKIFNPYTWSTIETQAAKLVSTKPSGTYIADPSDGEAPEDLGDRLGKWFDDCWRKDRATHKLQSVFKKGCIYGPVAARVYWKFKIGYLGGEKTIVEDRPTFDVLRLEDGMVGFDTEPDEWGKIRWAYQKYYVSKAEVKGWQEGPEGESFDKKAIKEALEDWEEYTPETTREDKLAKQGTTALKDDTIKKVECIYMEDYETGDFITCLGRKHIVRNEKNPYLFQSSFIFYNNSIVPSEIMGMGDIEPTERLQHGINLIRNQRFDNVASILKNQWIVADGVVDDDELVDEFNGIIHARANEIEKAIKPIMKPNVTQSSYEEEAALKGDFQQALSVTNYSKGSDEVATERSGRAIRALQEAADARVRNKLDLLEVTFIKEIAEKWLQLAAQYQSEPVSLSDSGNIIQITPEEFQLKFNYHVEAGSTKHTDIWEDRHDFNEYMDRLLILAEKKRADEMTQQQSMMQNPGMQPGMPANPDGGNMMPQQPTPQVSPTPINWDKLAEELSERYAIKNWKEIWQQVEEQQEPRGEMLPEVGEEEPRPTDFGEGEFLPNVDMPEMAQPMEQGTPQEMLPNIDNI